MSTFQQSIGERNSQAFAAAEYGCQVIRKDTNMKRVVVSHFFFILKRR